MTARELHTQAETARESGDFATSLELTDRAFVSYIQEDDLLGASEVMCSRFNVFKHLHQQVSPQMADAYQVQAHHSVLVAVEIAQNSRLPQALALPYFNTGKYYQEFETDWQQAAIYFQKAFDNLNNFPPPNHDRLAVRIDFQVHLLFARGMAGDDQVIPKLESLAQQLSSLDEDKYSKDVWTSGAYMRLARLSHHFQKLPQVTSYIDKAAQIIDSNPSLTLRSQQLDELKKTLS